MKNKIIISLLAAVVVFAAGCGDKDFSVINPKTAAQDTGDLKLNYALGDLVKLGKYSGIDLHKKETVIEEKQIISKMMSLAGGFKDKTFTTDTKEVIENGDIVNIDFEGFVDGSDKSLDSTTAKEFVLGIGSGAFIKGFEEQLIGHKVGEEKFDVNVKFPEDYGEESMAGKPARFEIKINGVVRDKDVAANTESKTLTEWKEAAKAELVKESDELATRSLKEEALNVLAGFSMAKRVPDDLLKKYEQNRMDNLYKPYAEQMGMTVDELKEQYGITDEVLTQEAQNDLFKEMIIIAIAKKEKMTVTAEELKTEKESVIGEGKLFADEKAYNEANAAEQLISNILYGKVLDFVVEKANVITVNEEEYSKLLKRGVVEEADEEVDEEEDIEIEETDETEEESDETEVESKN